MYVCTTCSTLSARYLPAYLTYFGSLILSPLLFLFPRLSWTGLQVNGVHLYMHLVYEVWGGG